MFACDRKLGVSPIEQDVWGLSIDLFVFLMNSVQRCRWSSSAGFPTAALQQVRTAATVKRSVTYWGKTSWKTPDLRVKTIPSTLWERLLSGWS